MRKSFPTTEALLGHSPGARKTLMCSLVLTMNSKIPVKSSCPFPGESIILSEQFDQAINPIELARTETMVSKSKNTMSKMKNPNFMFGSRRDRQPKPRNNQCLLIKPNTLCVRKLSGTQVCCLQFFIGLSLACLGQSSVYFDYCP